MQIRICDFHCEAYTTSLQDLFFLDAVDANDGECPLCECDDTWDPDDPIGGWSGDEVRDAEKAWALDGFEVYNTREVDNKDIYGNPWKVGNSHQY